jgi:hypothetical protein
MATATPNVVVEIPLEFVVAAPDEVLGEMVPLAAEPVLAVVGVVDAVETVEVSLHVDCQRPQTTRARLSR